MFVAYFLGRMREFETENEARQFMQRMADERNQCWEIGYIVENRVIWI